MSGQAWKPWYYEKCMQITYLGHSAFKLKGKTGVVVTDPYKTEAVGLHFPSVSADLVSISFNDAGHNALENVSPYASREKVFVVSKPGEYEVSGISIFGVPTTFKNETGQSTVENNIFTILLENLRICHLGQLNSELTAKQVEAIGSVDILLCPVGGLNTIDVAQAIKTIRQIEPSIVIPMYFKTASHRLPEFADLDPVEKFLHAYGVETTPVPALEISSLRLPEETEVVVLIPTAA